MSSTFDNHCGQCGYLLPPGSTSCPNCGAPVSASQPGAATPPPAPPSEYFPGLAEQMDSAETIVRMRPEAGWGSQPSEAASPASPSPGSGALPLPGQSGPTSPQPVPPSGSFAPTPSTPLWPGMPQGAGGPMGEAQQPPAGSGWAGAPSGTTAPLGSTFAYQGQPAPSGEMFGGPPSGQYGAPPGAYAPGFAAAPAQPKPPLPRWFTIGAAALVVVGLFLVWLTGNDWANGGLRAGIAALVAGAIVLIAFLVRFSQGYRGQRTVGLALASVLLLIIVGAAGIALQGPVHSLQGSSLDGQQKFAAAVSEYSAAGDSLGVARTYNDWGEQLLKQGSYSVPDDPTQQATDGALAKFDFVLNAKNGFTNSTDASIQEQVTRAKEGLVNTVLAWGDAHLNTSDYEGAVNRFKIVLDHKDLYGAASAFPRLHKDAARAYLGLGQQQVTSGDCADAVQNYQIVVKDYSDTPQGAQASADLKKPQNVTGRIVNVKTGQPAKNVKLFLSAQWQLVGNAFTDSHDYNVTSDANGSFTFANITPSDTKYLISYISTAGGEAITISRASGQPANVVTVAPLCATDAGTVLQF